MSGRVVARIEQILDPGDFLQQPRQVHVLREVARERGRTRVGRVVQRPRSSPNASAAELSRAQGHAQRAAHFGERARVSPGAHRHLRGASGQGGDGDAVRLGESVGNGRFGHRGGRIGGSMPGSGGSDGAAALFCSPRM